MMFMMWINKPRYFRLHLEETGGAYVSAHAAPHDKPTAPALIASHPPPILLPRVHAVLTPVPSSSIIRRHVRAFPLKHVSFPSSYTCYFFSSIIFFKKKLVHPSLPIFNQTYVQVGPRWFIKLAEYVSAGQAADLPALRVGVPHPDLSLGWRIRWVSACGILEFQVRWSPHEPFDGAQVSRARRIR